MHTRWLVAGLLLALGFARPAPAAAPSAKPPAPTPQEVEFFEKKVRPLLAENCFACHGRKKQEGDIRLDSRPAVLQGNEEGPVLVPGDPAKSRLVRAVRYEGEHQMPPKGKLPDAAIADLTAWVKMGVPYPESAVAPRTDPNTAKDHWAFRPVREPTPPAVRDTAWPANPIDRFILARLEAKGLTPSPAADRRTLLRRVSFDLIGLPPTAAEIDAFVNDSSPDAYAKVVDGLLASPRYGERWGRHWLDLARYADSKGYVFTEERRYPFAYTYRDYVIKAFNDDLPYDQFIVQQLAADRLPLKDDPAPLAALGFLTIGRRFLNNIHDIIDDRIDVTMKSFQGLTVTCARCHDHKFDPIPIKDYYSLYGVFASSVEPKELPLLITPKVSPELRAFEQEMKIRQGAVDQYLAKRHAELLPTWRTPAALSAYLLAVADLRRQPGTALPVLARERELNRAVLQRWRAFLDDAVKRKAPAFAPWHRFAVLTDAEVAAKAPELLAQLAKAKPPADPAVLRALTAQKLANLGDVAKVYGTLLAAATNKQGGSNGLRKAVLGPDAPPNVPLAQIEQTFGQGDRNKLAALRRRVEQHKASAAAPPRAMVLNDAPRPRPARVFVRGNPNNPGEEVPRQFLKVLAGENRKPFTDGSGRLELARAIASRDNPLTARVMVNRVWQHHFGRGLVTTPSDFGTRSDPPTHPELLDFLASRFVAEGWSVKRLHRLILLSRAYQQSSADRPELAKADPENRLLGRMERQRLDFEELRDSLLMAAGHLDPTAGGPSVDLFARPFTHRRTVYGFIERQNLPGTFRTFDFASPDSHSPQRFTTTVPQQALFLMNSPFVAEQARQLIRLADVQAAASPAARVQALYRRAYGRAAGADEVALGTAFVASAGEKGKPVEEAAVWQYGYGAYDEKAKRLKEFTPLTHWTGSAWQGGPQYPGPKLGWVRVTAKGGHPGNDQAHAAVRRWVAPRGGVLSVEGSLDHEMQGVGSRGDGVRGRIVSSRSGELGKWEVHHRKQETAIARIEVKKGDTLDFVVDCRTSPDYDAFSWSPVVREVGGAGVWNALKDFGGPAEPSGFGPWEQYAQVLLLANEFAFAD